MTTGVRPRAVRDAAWAVLVLSVICDVGFAATTRYQYDALGRLRRVVHDNGLVTGYTLDAAGNRTEVTDAPVTPPSAPSSISVPPSNSYGRYNITWSVASGTVLAYELYESASPSFAAQTLTYSGTALVALITGKGEGTYYYRVRACAGATCSGFATGTNGVVVSFPPTPPDPPTSPIKTFIANCAWRANWVAPVGGVPFAYYVVTDTQGNQQTVTATLAYVNCPVNNQNGNKPSTVRACATANNCSTSVSFP